MPNRATVTDPMENRLQPSLQSRLSLISVVPEVQFETQLYVMSAHTSGVMKWRGIKIISSREKF